MYNDFIHFNQLFFNWVLWRGKSVIPAFSGIFLTPLISTFHFCELPRNVLPLLFAKFSLQIILSRKLFLVLSPAWILMQVCIDPRWRRTEVIPLQHFQLGGRFGLNEAELKIHKKKMCHPSGYKQLACHIIFLFSVSSQCGGIVIPSNTQFKNSLKNPLFAWIIFSFFVRKEQWNWIYWDLGLVPPAPCTKTNSSSLVLNWFCPYQQLEL